MFDYSITFDLKLKTAAPNQQIIYVFNVYNIIWFNLTGDFPFQQNNKQKLFFNKIE